MREMVVDGETGFTVPSDDAAALAARLVELLQDDARGREMGLAGRRRAQELFTWPACARVIGQHLERIRGRFGPGVSQAG
jgi:starch synthase